MRFNNLKELMCASYKSAGFKEYKTEEDLMCAPRGWMETADGKVMVKVLNQLSLTTFSEIEQ